MPQSAMNQHAVQEGWHHLGEQQRAVVVVDQLSAQQKASAIFLPGWWDVRGWGFGVSIVTRRDSIWTSPGQFGWGGAFGTSWITDPRENLVAILMIQCMDFPPRPAGIHADFLTSVYQALED